MKDSKNLILAVVLSALVLLGWTWAANKYFPTANPPSTKIEAGKQQALPEPQAQPAPSSPARQQSISAALASSPRVAIRTPSLQGSINLKGAQIDDLLLVDQKQTIAKNSPPVRLLSPLGTSGAYIAEFGWTAQDAQVPTLDTVWTADSQELTPDHPVTLSTQMSDGTRYQLKFSVDDGFLFTVRQSVPMARGSRSAYAPSGSSAAVRSQRTVRAGPTMSGRSAFSTARPSMTSTGRTSTRARPNLSTTPQVGSASPTNIG